MNRKARRKNKEEKRAAVYNLTYDQIEQIKQKAVVEAVEKMIPIEARSKLREIKSSNETMFRNYKKAKIYILREVE